MEANMAEKHPGYIRWFDELNADDVSLVGGKNASLGEMYRKLTPRGVPVPNGFATTADAYRDMLTVAGAWERLHALLDDVDKHVLEVEKRLGIQPREPAGHI
jgi:pyruvate,water dikinase